LYAKDDAYNDLLSLSRQRDKSEQGDCISVSDFPEQTEITILEVLGILGLVFDVLMWLSVIKQLVYLQHKSAAM
jgi:hypothetical protein